MGTIMMMDIDEILDQILDEIKKYDGSVESGVEIIELNQIRIDRLKCLFGKEDIDLTIYQSKIEVVMENQSKLFKSLETKKAELLKILGQINKKNKVVHSYMSTNRKPIFVDKDI